MTITLTTEELQKYANEVSQWHYDCITFILTHYSPRDFDTMFVDRPTDHLMKLRKRYEDEHPKPDWRSLL